MFAILGHKPCIRRHFLLSSSSLFLFFSAFPLSLLCLSLSPFFLRSRFCSAPCGALCVCVSPPRSCGDGVIPRYFFSLFSVFLPFFVPVSLSLFPSLSLSLPLSGRGQRDPGSSLCQGSSAPVVGRQSEDAHSTYLQCGPCAKIRRRPLPCLGLNIANRTFPGVDMHRQCQCVSVCACAWLCVCVCEPASTRGRGVIPRWLSSFLLFLFLSPCSLSTPVSRRGCQLARATPEMLARVHSHSGALA